MFILTQRGKMLVETRKFTDVSIQANRIIASTIDNCDWILGDYETDEQAQEAFEDLQSAITYGIKLHKMKEFF